MTCGRGHENGECDSKEGEEENHMFNKQQQDDTQCGKTYNKGRGIILIL